VAGFEVAFGKFDTTFTGFGMRFGFGAARWHAWVSAYDSVMENLRLPVAIVCQWCGAGAGELKWRSAAWAREWAKITPQGMTQFKGICSTTMKWPPLCGHGVRATLPDTTLLGMGGTIGTGGTAGMLRGSKLGSTTTKDFWWPEIWSMGT